MLSQVIKGENYLGLKKLRGIYIFFEMALNRGLSIVLEAKIMLTLDRTWL